MNLRMEEYQMKVKRIISILLCVLTLCSLFTLPGFAKDEKAEEVLRTNVGVLAFFVDEFGNAQLESCDPTAKGTVVVPSTVEIDELKYNVRKIGDGAFRDCIYIQRITISEGITQIGNKAFENCTALETLDVPRSLMSCQYDAFDGCNMVTVNGYTENYQFFAVNFFSKNITFNRIDPDLKPADNEKTNSLMSFVRAILSYILGLFGIKL